MTALPPPSARLVASWDANADAWAGAVRSGAIASRRLVTDAAVVQAVEAATAGIARPRVLDVGCGEGWLARTLTERGADVVGTDVSEALVEAAQAAGGGTFHALAYDALTARFAADPGTLGGRFDAAVCNFALLDDAPDGLLRALRGAVRAGGALVVQTLHPAAQDGPYVDGWREETFAAMGGGFAAPMPWYFRTVGGWVDVVLRAGWTLARIDEPVHPETHRPLSLLLTARA